jgi:hypothetical protein
MNRYPSEQLMTVEEAERLSELHTGRNRRKQPVRQPSLWAWQSVSGVLEQAVTRKKNVRLKLLRTDARMARAQDALERPDRH